jgi:hypothetical protein
MPRVLIYSQDRGGANIVARVARRLRQSVELADAVVAVHPLSESTFRALDVDAVPLSALLPSVPALQEDVERCLWDRQFTHVVCSTSSPLRDKTNGHLIASARRLGIPTLGFLDHWLGFYRFRDEEGEPVYLPDAVACIDEYCVRRMSEVGLHPKWIGVVGHPHLESVADTAMPFTHLPGEPIRVLLVSQPSLREQSFRSVFHESVDGRPFMDSFAEIIQATASGSPALLVKYRPHPKEVGSPTLPPWITFDSTSPGAAHLGQYDVFIGATSMILIEAAVAGRYVIRLDVASWLEAVPERIPADTGGRVVRSLDEFRVAFADIVRRLGHGKPPPQCPTPHTRDALNRACDLVMRFTRSELPGIDYRPEAVRAAR